MTISVIIPTRNRAESLHRLLGALSQQDRRPEEVIVVDASDTPADGIALGASYPALRIATLRAAPSVCGQRNAGIRRASGSHVLLCDDDVEPPPGYISRLAAHLEGEPATGAVTGMVAEADSAGQPVPELRALSFRSLLFASVFQLPVWGDIEATRSTWFTVTAAGRAQEVVSKSRQHLVAGRVAARDPGENPGDAHCRLRAGRGARSARLAARLAV